MTTTGSPHNSKREMRADALRNQTRLLAAAKAVFAEGGADGSLEEIARRAGVGIGTLYRHFPTRQELLETVLLEDLVDLREAADSRLFAPSAGEALTTWLRALYGKARTYR